jgi:hypothetical protein
MARTGTQHAGGLGVPLLIALSTVVVSSVLVVGGRASSAAARTSGTKRAVHQVGFPSYDSGNGVAAAASGNSLVRAGTRIAFVPWGFNYARATGTFDHGADPAASTDWPQIAADFATMHELHANIVRVYLQFNKFVDPPTQHSPNGTPNRSALADLSRLLWVAHHAGLHLDITGLGIERAYQPSLCTGAELQKANPPKWCWYNEITSTARRWAAQAVFWRSVAQTVNKSPARHVVAWFDLMNEPIATNAKSWCLGTVDGYCYVQALASGSDRRSARTLAAAWAQTMRRTIRRTGNTTLLSTGLIMLGPTSSKPTGCSMVHGHGAWAAAIARSFDLVAIHVYPRGRIPLWIQSANNCKVPGKPLVIEETFNLRATPLNEQRFVAGTQSGSARPYNRHARYPTGVRITYKHAIYTAKRFTTGHSPKTRTGIDPNWQRDCTVFRKSATYRTGSVVMYAQTIYRAAHTSSGRLPRVGRTWTPMYAAPSVNGWLGHYLVTPGDIARDRRAGKETIKEAMQQGWFDLFTRLTPWITARH